MLQWRAGLVDIRKIHNASHRICIVRVKDKVVAVPLFVCFILVSAEVSGLICLAIPR